MMKFITAIKLSELFKNCKDGQRIFPELIKRLIIASANTLEYIRFPAGDAIYSPGFDGKVTKIKTNSRFVPNGDSFWEVGTNLNPINKLRTDFNKRKPNKKVTFVFCTPHVLDVDKAENELKEKPKYNLWKGVKIIDVNVLEDWLAENVEVAIWLLNEFNINVSENSIKILKDEANRIHNLTEPKMNDEFLICSNTANAQKLANELSTTNTSKIITIKTSTGLEHGYFFVIGALRLCHNISITSRVIIVKNQNALNYVKNNCVNKIVILNFNCTDDELLPNKNIFIDFTLEDYKDAFITIEQLRINDYAKCLEGMGIDVIKAGKITADLNRNILCFKRKYAVLGINKTPAWASKANRMDIIPIALVTKFDSDCAGDCAIVAELAGMPIMDYLDKLDNWLQVDDSPISRNNNSYFVNSKEEVLSVLQLSMQSSKVKLLTKLLDDILTVPNPKYKKDAKDWQITKFDDEKPKNTLSLIQGVISTFAILSNSGDYSNLDLCVKNIINKMKNDCICLHSILEHFSLLSEVSPSAVLDYIEGAIDSNDPIFKQVIEQSYGLLFSISDVQCVMETIHNCLQRKGSVIQALRVYLKLYYADYNLPTSMNLKNDLVTVLAPITSGHLVAATAKDKFNLFATVAKGKDEEKTLEIISKIKSVHVFLGFSLPKWKVADKDEIEVTDADIFEVDDLINKWLRKNTTDKLSLIKKLVLAIPENSVVTNNDNFNFIENKIVDLTEQEVIELHYFVIQQIYKIRHFANSKSEFWNYKNKFICRLEKIYNLTLPNELFDRYAYVFKYHLFSLPILNPTPFSSNTIHNDDKVKETFVENCIRELVEHYGQEIIFKIIDKCEKGFLLGKCLQKYFTNYIEAIKYTIKFDKIYLITDFLNTVSADELIHIFNQLTTNEKNKFAPYLPLHEILIDFFDGTEYESYYWAERTSCLKVDKKLFDNKIFIKLIKYNPVLLIDWLEVYDKEVRYDQYLLFLNTISDYLGKLVGYQFDLLNNIIKRVDSMFYTNELAQAELKFLPYYFNTTEDFPLGIKKYYWDNPSGFVDMVNASVKCLNKPNTVGSRIIYSLIVPFRQRCWIPAEYMITNSEGFKKWVNVVLTTKNNYDEKTAKYIDIAIINIMALQPFLEDAVWPSKMVADLLELIAGDKLEKRKNIAAQFYCAKVNSQGIRSVSDGIDELRMYEKYTAYKNFYAATHPTTSLALEYIAEIYKHESDMDKQQTITGWE